MQSPMPIDEGIKNLSEINRHTFSTSATFGDATYSPGGTYGPRRQRDFQLVLLKSGSARILVDGSAFELQEGDVALLKPGPTEHFLFSRKKETRHTWVSVFPDFVPERLASELATCSTVTTISSRLNTIVNLGLATWDAESSESWLQALGLCALEAFLSDVNMTPLTMQSGTVEKARKYIEAHLNEPMNLTEIAKSAFVSPQHLTRLFRNQLGTTPSRYLWARRTEIGAQLICETGLSFSEIASMTGFQSPYHLSRLVKTKLGVCPRDLRTQAWSSQLRPSLDSGEQRSNESE